MLNGSRTNQAKGMCKTHWILKQITYGIWWYDRGRDKSNWKGSMIFNDAICVQNENDNAENIGTLKVDGCICVMHGV